MVFSLFPRKSASVLLFRETVQTQYLNKRKKRCTKTSLFRRSIFLTPQSSNFCQFVFGARGAMLRARHVASAVSTGLSCTVHESERFRASTRAIRRWETSSGAPETGLEHCAWSPSARGCWAREAPTRKEASRGPWVGGWWHGRGGVWGWRARWGCEGGCVASGHGARVGEGWSTPRVLTAWEGRVCVA